MKKILTLLTLLFTLSSILGQEVKLLPSTSSIGDLFGASLDIDGDYAVVGSPGDSVVGTFSGSAYVFKYDDSLGWNQEAKLQPSDPKSFGSFGSYGGVAIDGNCIIVGSPHNFAISDTGFAYIFKSTGTTWNQEAKLIPSNTAYNSDFGSAVDICGDIALISDNSDAFVFRKTGNIWNEEAILMTSLVGSFAGGQVKLTENYAFIGAPTEDVSIFPQAGSVFIFENIGTTWALIATLTASDASSYNFFGNSLSVYEDYLIIGAQGYGQIVANNTGAAYIFKKNGSTWTEQAKLTAFDGMIDDYFGNRVSLSSNYAIVGAPGNDVMGLNAGASYLFKRNGNNWNFEQKITPFDISSDDYFGQIRFWNHKLIAGSPSSLTLNGTKSGSAYIFELNFEPVVENQLLDLNLPEDFASIQIANLDTVFFDLNPNDSLVYSFTTLNNLVGGNTQDSILTLSSIPNAFGIETVIVAAIDTSLFSVSDTFLVNISPVNDLPETFNLLSPSNLDTVSSLNFSFEWNSSKNIDNEQLLYELKIFNSFFDTTITNLTDTTFFFFGEDTLELDETYFWSVSVSDSFSTVTSLDTFSFVTPVTISVLENKNNLENKFALSTNYPNPFNPTTTINYQLAKDTKGKLTIFNILGKEVKQWNLNSNFGKVIWNGTDSSKNPVSAGIYFYRLETREFQAVRKMLLLK